MYWLCDYCSLGSIGQPRPARAPRGGRGRTELASAVSEDSRLGRRGAVSRIRAGLQPKACSPRRRPAHREESRRRPLRLLRSVVRTTKIETRSLTKAIRGPGPERVDEAVRERDRHLRPGRDFVVGGVVTAIVERTAMPYCPAHLLRGVDQDRRQSCLRRLCACEGGDRDRYVTRTGPRRRGSAREEYPPSRSRL